MANFKRSCAAYRLQPYRDMNVASLPRTPIYLLVLGASCTALAINASDADDDDANDRVASHGSASTFVPVSAARGPVLPALPELEQADDVEPVDDDELRGHAPIVDPAEFAFVYTVDGVDYVRLSTGERATSRGTPRLITEGDVFAVVAPVSASAMPEQFRAWLGRTVLVDGTCASRVVGFAEVSRVAGMPPEARYYEEEYDPDAEAAEWTIESVTADNVELAAQLDGTCGGTWARADSYPAATVATKLDDSKLETAARADLLARRADDPVQEQWQESGGEGDWRDAVDVVTSTYQHALTDERWVIVQARLAGGCGEPGVEEMAVYRANPDGTVRRVADLGYALEDIEQVVDLDGDGQPELLTARDGDLSLVDLAGESHDAIGVPERYDGCGC